MGAWVISCPFDDFGDEGILPLSFCCMALAGLTEGSRLDVESDTDWQGTRHANQLHDHYMNKEASEILTPDG